MISKEKDRAAIIHNVEILPNYFVLVNAGIKTSEVRRLDRDYRVGDYLKLHEHDGNVYTGKVLTCVITHVLTDEEYVKEGFCVLSFQIVSPLNKTVPVEVWGNMFQNWCEAMDQVDSLRAQLKEGV